VKRAALVSSVCLAASVVSGCVGNSQSPKPQPERASEINLEIGIDYLRKGNLQQAKDKIDRALEQNPRNAKAQSMAGMLYDRLNEPAKAESHFERAVSLDPKDPDIKNNYAVYSCQTGRYDRGEKLATQAAENPLYKTPEIGFLNAGNCARSAGELQRAEEHYRRALGVQPRFGEALLQMADLELRQNESMSARAFLERYLAVGKTTAATLWLGHRIEQNLGNKAQAQHYAQRLKTEYPSAAQTQELLESERNPG
jgi:type IV pilus assembly protein PilF